MLIYLRKASAEGRVVHSRGKYMMNNKISRRDVGKFVATGMLLATGVSVAQVVKASGAAKVRRDITDIKFGAEATQRYREAVAALKALPSNDLRNWHNLSVIHRDHCPHGNWYFLPWHRAYLAAFEAICREVIQDADFALPYWNWTVFRQLPRGFINAEEGGVENPLFHGARVMKENDTLSSILAPHGIDAEEIFGTAKLDQILKSTSFQEFGSTKPRRQNDLDETWQRAGGRKTALEREPHDYLHGVVGGDMGDPRISPQDPIFYLHHCNIDRIWSRWNRNGGKNESDLYWLDFTFRENFPLADGGPGGNLKVADLLDTSALGYIYDDDGVPFSLKQRPSPNFDELSLPPQKWAKPIQTGKVSELPLDTFEEFKAQTIAAVREADLSPRIFVILNGVTRPKNPRTNVRVFLNCDYLTPLTPVDDPHYAGSFTFFTMDHDHGDHTAVQSFAFDITETARAITAAGGRVDQELLVQLVPLSFDGTSLEENEFSVSDIEVAAI